MSEKSKTICPSLNYSLKSKNPLIFQSFNENLGANHCTLTA